MNEPIAPITLPVDRFNGFVRSIWRLLAAGLALGAAFLIAILVGNWRLLWQSQPMTCVALGVLTIGVALSGLALLAAGLPWLLLALWPGRLFVRIDANAIDVALGPFGRMGTPWSSIAGDTLEGYDAEMLEQLPDDAFTPVLRDHRTGLDLFARIQSRAGMPAERLTRAVRPFLRIES